MEHFFMNRLNMTKKIRGIFIFCLVVGLIFAALTIYAYVNGERVKNLEKQIKDFGTASSLTEAEKLLQEANDFYKTDQELESVDVGVVEEIQLTTMEQVTMWLYKNVRTLLVLAADLLIGAVVCVFLTLRKKKRKKTDNESTKVKSTSSIIGIFIAFCILFFDLALLSESFMKVGNFLNVLQQINVNFVISIGMAFVIISGGIDLSVGSNVGLSAYFMAIMMNWWHIGVIPSIVIGILLATFFGMISGFIITFFKVPPFIGTLGMMYLGRGIVYTISGGNTIHNFPDAFRAIASRVGGIPLYAILIMAGVLFLAWYILRYTRFGRFVYAIGGNETCAKLSGINVSRFKWLVYTVSGFCCGIAAMMLTSRLDSTVAMTGEGYELDAIAAVIIGGTSLNGGEGSVFGTLIGILIIGFISNGLNLLGVAQGPQKMVKGVIILIAVIIDVYRRKAAESA